MICTLFDLPIYNHSFSSAQYSKYCLQSLQTNKINHIYLMIIILPIYPCPCRDLFCIMISLLLNLIRTSGWHNITKFAQVKGRRFMSVPYNLRYLYRHILKANNSTGLFLPSFDSRGVQIDALNL